MLVSTDKKWDYALGMIKVDGLELSPEFKKLIFISTYRYEKSEQRYLKFY